jgi:hypothetical protein
MKIDSDIKVFEDREGRSEWRVEYLDDDGGCYVAIFSGPAAEMRARDYQAALVAGRVRPIPPHILKT